MSERDSLVITRYLDLPSNSGHATKSVNFQSEVTHMTKTLSTSKDIRKQDSSEFRGEALKLAECTGNGHDREEALKRARTSKTVEALMCNVSPIQR